MGVAYRIFSLGDREITKESRDVDEWLIRVLAIAGIPPAACVCRISVWRCQSQSVVVDMIEQAAQLHDVGKIGIPDSILQNPDKLTDGERQEMQLHSGYGKKIRQSVTQQGQHSTLVHSQIGGQILEATHSPLLQMAHRIALTHHERWDGTGYPIGLAGNDIRLEGRITVVSDVFDALSSQRLYKKAFPVDECFRILDEGCGTHFEPDVLHAFFRCGDEAVPVQMDFLDTDRSIWHPSLHGVHETLLCVSTHDIDGAGVCRRRTGNMILRRKQGRGRTTWDFNPVTPSLV